MHFKFAAIAIACCTAAVPAAVQAQPLSGDIGVFNKYLDDDLLPLTNQPVAQANVSLDLGKGFSINSFATHGLSTSRGGEVDLGGSYDFTVGEFEFNIAADRYFLRKLSDMTAVSASVEYSGVDITVSHYIWNQNPDATRIVAGYTVEASENLSLRPMVTYQTGFGERDVAGGGMSVSYAFTENLALTAKALTPIKGDRDTQASVGLQFSF